LKVIEAAAVAACDARDGVADGVLDDPAKCGFDPGTLLCKGEESDSCLTQPQVTALKKIYEGPRTSKGEQVFPGYVPGGETGGGGWNLWITATKSAQFMFGTQFFGNMVFENASWDYKTFNVDRDVKVADDKTARILNSTDPNLKAFKNRGGKLILYHGWSDAAIPPQNTINYYDSVVSTMGRAEADQFTRLYMVPGMQHCYGGPGPSSFGQSGTVYQSPADARHDVSVAIEDWVEKGVAPEAIIATKPVSDGDPTKGALRTRPLCVYPLVARWKGSGSTDDAANFTCAKEETGK
jgi:tannase/feruloyl esterase